MMKLSTTVFATVAALTVALTAGCGHDHGDEHEDPAAEACTHLKGTPVAVQASATAEAAPVLGEAHTRYLVALPSGNPSGRSGAVAFSATPGPLLVFLGADVGLEVKTSAGATLMPKTSKTSGAPCPELAAWYEFDVPVGRLNLTLGGPTNERDAVDVVLEAGHHD